HEDGRRAAPAGQDVARIGQLAAAAPGAVGVDVLIHRGGDEERQHHQHQQIAVEGLPEHERAQIQVAHDDERIKHPLGERDQG
ncbi:conserved hypothetical protein, partial [Ricinus communis]